MDSVSPHHVTKNPIVGVLLVVAAFGLLFWNERRVDVSQLAATSREIISDGDYLKPGQKNEVYELVLGDRTQALGRLQGQEQMMTWVARVVGFLLMWGGLIALLQKFMANVTPGKARLIGLVIAALLTVGTVFIAAA